MTQDKRIDQVSFKAGDLLFTEGDTTYHFFVIQEGEVEIYKTTTEGKRIPLGLVSAGASLGEFAMLDHMPRSATARALTDVSAARVSEEAYEQLINELPEWAVAVMRGMIDRIRATNDIIRRHGMVSETVKKQIAAVEFDPNAPDPFDSDDSPFLANDDT
jgi:CRP/FNR family cyclic AMP-dependent transcriptional regulator